MRWSRLFFGVTIVPSRSASAQEEEGHQRLCGWRRIPQLTPKGITAWPREHVGEVDRSRTPPPQICKIESRKQSAKKKYCPTSSNLQRDSSLQRGPLMEHRALHLSMRGETGAPRWQWTPVHQRAAHLVEHKPTMLQDPSERCHIRQATERAHLFRCSELAKREPASRCAPLGRSRPDSLALPTTKTDHWRSAGQVFWEAEQACNFGAQKRSTPVQRSVQ